MNERREPGPDRWLLLATIILIFAGVFLVFDASYARAGQSASTGYNPFYYLRRQAVWAGVALLALWCGSRFPYLRLRRFWFHGTVASIFLLVLVLIIGPEINGSKRWIMFGPLAFQPSEFAKLAVVIFLATYSDLWRQRIRDFRRGFLPPVAVLMVIGALVAKEDLGTAISLVGTGLVMIYLAGARPAHMAGLGLATVAAGCLLVLVEPYRMDRIHAWLDPWGHYDGPGYQPVHGLIALGSGGLLGQGIARGTQKFLYLPAEHTDYIFATVGEELGLLGAGLLLAGFAFVVVRGLTIAHRTRDWFGAQLAAGLTCLLGLQALLNVAVVTAAVPATGVPLPFISYGGSSLLFTALAVGIILSISQHPAARAAEAAAGPGAAQRPEELRARGRERAPRVGRAPRG